MSSVELIAKPTAADVKTLEDGNCYYACFYKKFGIVRIIIVCEYEQVSRFGELQSLFFLKMNEDGSYDSAAIKTKFSKPNSVSNEAVQKKLDEVTQKYCQDKGTVAIFCPSMMLQLLIMAFIIHYFLVGNYCNLATCLSKVSKDQWEI